MCVSVYVCFCLCSFVMIFVWTIQLWGTSATQIVHELTGVLMHPPMIPHEWHHFVQVTLRNDTSDVTRKKLGLTTHFDHFSKWPLQNLRFPIARKLLHVGSWFGGLNQYFRGQGIRWTQYGVWPTIIMCVKGQNILKNPRWPPNSHFISVNIS